ncbi:MAG TPA: L,D-transpeptidase [Sphingomicrobium sp.]|nr:L,D-transpeptidase [Sphingomicrobium sp.]
MTKLLGAIGAAVLAAALPASGALAQGSPTSAPAAVLDQPASLKPGQWVWAPELAPHGPLLVYVDLTRQLATVYRNGVRFAVTTISSGKPGHDTPTGVFTILQKDANHRSSKYNDAPMPYQERLTWDGVALHAGGLPGYPESHGCVHLPLEFAKLLFGIESLGGTVIITGGHNDPVKRPAAGLLEPAVAGSEPPAPLAPGQQFSWNPAASPAGPVSIIVSLADRQAIVLRNGVEIGRSVAEVPQPPQGTQVMTYAGGPDDHWVAVDVAGASGQGADSAPIKQLKLPPAFAAQMRSVLAPGTTLVVTPDPLGAASTGPQLTVLAAAEAPR